MQLSFIAYYKQVTHTNILRFHACATGLNTDGPISQMVGNQITSKPTNAVGHDGLEPCTKIQI